MRPKIRDTILVLAALAAVSCNSSLAVIKPYDPQTMSYPITVDQAKSIARAWARQESLQLDLVGIDVTMSDIGQYLYALRTPDRSQSFSVDCNTGNVQFWLDSVYGQESSQRRKALDESTQLPVVELGDAVRTFVSERRPDFATLNMQPCDSAVPHGVYCQRLSNGVSFDGNAACAVIDEWTGRVFSYDAAFSTTPSISTQYTVTAAAAEQAALSYAGTVDLVVSGHGDDVITQHPQSVVLWKNHGVWVHRASPGQESLVWRIEVVLDEEPGLTLEQFTSELARDGGSGRWRYTIEVDANTGSAVRHSQMGFLLHNPPSALPPSFDVPGGTYTTSQTVSISCPNGCDSIRYTLDGSSPTYQSQLYAGPITVDHSLTLKARAFQADHLSSLVTSASYVIQ